MKRFILLLATILFCFSALKSIAQFSPEEADSLLHDFYNNQHYDRDEATKICEDLVLFYQDTGDTCKQIRASAKFAGLQRAASSFEESMATLIEAQKLFDTSNCDDELQALIYLYYSDLYRSLYEIKKSDSVCLLGINLFESDWENKAAIIKLYMQIEDYDNLPRTLAYLDTAYQLSREYKKPHLERRTLINIGTAYAVNDMYPEASKYYKLALNSALQQNAIYELGTLYNNLAGLSDDTSKTLLYVDSAIYYARLNNDLADLEDYSENKAYFYSTIGNFEEGYYQLWEAMVLKDSLLNIRKYEAIAELEHKYEAEKKTNEIQKLKVENLKTEVENLNFRRNQNKLFIGIVVMLMLAVFFAIGFVSTRRHRNKLAVKNVEIDTARQLSDELLLNILPAEIALELKEKGKAEARKFDQVSILFTDFKEFTQASEKLSAKELVEKINYCFKAFDDIIEKYGIEKIKTIGDAYMAAGGLTADPKSSVKNTILAGIEMQQFILDRESELKQSGEIAFEMRVGIHTGPVVAGIIGVKKFQYDIWGDTVNTASRMESNSEVGKINISGDTFEIIKNDPEFSFVNRGKIPAKGKGEIEMYFVSLKK